MLAKDNHGHVHAISGEGSSGLLHALPSAVFFSIDKSMDLLMDLIMVPTMDLAIDLIAGAIVDLIANAAAGLIMDLINDSIARLAKAASRLA
jgi:hypothetical protein